MPRTQRTEEQTRRLVADAVVEHVARHGIDAVPDVPMERILQDAGVSRASAYRIWSGRSAFRAFALEQCAAGHAMQTLDPARARELAEEALAAENDRLHSAAHFVTTAAAEELALMLRSDRWRAFFAFQAVALHTSSPEIAETLARIDRQDVGRLSAFYSGVADAWSLDLLGGTTVEDVASAALLVARSTVARAVAGTDVGPARRSYLTALGALVRGSFRARPGADADLGRLLVGPAGVQQGGDAQ